MKKRWVEELRITKVKQCKNFLHCADGSMDVLGVLCDIEIDGDWTLIQTTSGKSVYSIHHYHDELPIGLSGDLGDLNEYIISELNDVGLSFKELANYIEKRF